MMDQFEILDLVGEGSFGRVFKGRLKSSNELVALKLIPKVGHGQRELKNLRSECKIQQTLSHPNIVRMMDAFETVNEVVAVTEFVSGGDLHQLVAHNKPSLKRLEEVRVREIAVDLISACSYLHSNRILHRDIKPQNVLITPGSGRAKLCDFGFARNLGINTYVLTSIKGTPLYMAPELIEEKPYDYSADIWSVGCILYELIVGSPPFSTTSLFQLIKKVRYESINWNFVEDIRISQECLDFLQRLLEKDSKKRLCWPALLTHPYVKDRLCLQGIKSEEFLKDLTESQELAKEIQRQDRVKITSGSSQTLLKLAMTHEENKKKFANHYARRYSEISSNYNNNNNFNIHQRRPSDLSAQYLSNCVQPTKVSSPQPPPPPPFFKENKNPLLTELPLSSNPVGFIEYLTDMINDDEKKYIAIRETVQLIKSCLSFSSEMLCVDIIETLIIFLMSKDSIPNIHETSSSDISDFVSGLTGLVSHMILLKNKGENDEEIIYLIACYLSRCCLITKEFCKILIKSSFFIRDDEIISNLPQPHVLDILNCCLHINIFNPNIDFIVKVMNSILPNMTPKLLTSSFPNKISILISLIHKNLNKTNIRDDSSFIKCVDLIKTESNQTNIMFYNQSIIIEHLV